MLMQYAYACIHLHNLVLLFKIKIESKIFTQIVSGMIEYLYFIF